jgi:hypothetical protein
MTTDFGDLHVAEGDLIAAVACADDVDDLVGVEAGLLKGGLKRPLGGLHDVGPRLD